MAGKNEMDNEQVAKAFRMINEVGEKFVAKPLVAEKLGVPDRRELYRRMDNFAWHLRSKKNGVLKSFAFQGQTPPPDTVIYWWREDKKLERFEARVQEWGGEVPSRILDMTVEDVEFSVRTYNCLKNAYIQTIGELLFKTEDEMLRIRNFGRKSLNEIKEFLYSLDPVLELGILSLRQSKSGR